MNKPFSLQDHPYVELKNLLKFMDLVNSGGEAKIIVQQGDVYVNGQQELRRGRKLYAGDVVLCHGTTITIEE